jgi:hypothetical protein
VVEPRHQCPGLCGNTVPKHLLACGPCWWRLPAQLKRAVGRAYHRREHDPIGHQEAVAAAADWYRQQKEGTANG